MDARLAYRQATVGGASPVRLVILLYEQAIEDVRRALAALERGDIEARTRNINHALLVVGQLQSTLDKVQGGEVARNLERLYQQLRAGLLEAQRRQSEAVLQRQMTDLMLVHAAWCEVERTESGASTPGSERGSNSPAGHEARLSNDQSKGWRV
jgi:flagellar secretion chaperone FliS